MGCAGFVLSSISDSVEVLFFTFGIISGLGLGVIYVTAVVSIAFWFEAKRNFATGKCRKAFLDVNGFKLFLICLQGLVRVELALEHFCMLR